MATYQPSVMRAKDYRNCPIYVRKINGVFFEYLTIIHGQIYAAHMSVELSWWRSFWHELFGFALTDKEQKAAVVNCCKMAEATIDSVLDTKKH